MIYFFFAGLAVFVLAIIVAINRRTEPPQLIPDESLRLQKSTPTQKPRAAKRELSMLLPPKFIVLDLETTGLSRERDEIIEIGAILCTLGTDKCLVFQTLVKPSKPIIRKITQLTGITQAMIDAEGRNVAEALTMFAEFAGNLPIVTFNAEFDMGFIRSASMKHGLHFSNKYTCALKRARRAWPALPNHRLAYLAEIGNISIENTHRAVADCQRALIVFTSATETLNSKVRWTTPSPRIDA